jgi:hypothetical protein
LHHPRTHEPGITTCKCTPQRSADIPDQPPFKARLFNLDWNTQEDDVRDFFSGLDVISFTAITDRETGRAKGFGFVEFGDQYVDVSFENAACRGGGVLPCR